MGSAVLVEDHVTRRCLRETIRTCGFAPPCRGEMALIAGMIPCSISHFLSDANTMSIERRRAIKLLLRGETTLVGDPVVCADQLQGVDL